MGYSTEGWKSADVSFLKEDKRGGSKKRREQTGRVGQCSGSPALGSHAWSGKPQ